MPIYTDAVFAPIDLDHALERLAGGNETEVYRTDDGRHVVKLKADGGGSAAVAQRLACEMRDAAAGFAACLGPQHSIPSEYIVARDTQEHAQVLVIQPLLHDARPLYDLDYHALSSAERAAVATQLREIIARSLRFYRATGSMPDLYGRTSASATERRRNNNLLMLPQRMWSFVVQRNLLRSHNLMRAADGQIVLVDYDIVRRGRLYRQLYYAVRWMLFWRDHALVLLMRKGSAVPR